MKKLVVFILLSFFVSGLSAQRVHTEDYTVVLTFDDGCASHYSFVAPLLKKYGFGATFYMCEFPPNYSDSSKYMSWHQVAALSRMGFEIGNHTWHHTNINRISNDLFEKELTYIEKKCDSMGIPKPVSFAYPAYHTDSTKLPILSAHGYITARAGGDRAFDISRDEPLDVPSFTLIGDDSAYFYHALDQAGENKAIIFTIHGVPDVGHPWVSVSAPMFATYLQYLYDHHYRVIAMRDLHLPAH